MDSGAYQVSAGVQTLSQGTTEQSASVEGLVAHMMELSARIQDSAVRCKNASELVDKANGYAAQADTKMAQLTAATKNIDESSNQIGGIIKTIEDIAFQTNILALNAAVEAARAGAAGKGFAVVADEVRNLASKSSEAAQSAADMVTSTRAIIQTGVELTADTAVSFQNISAVSSQISRITDQLVTAVRGQESALAIMEEHIGTISAIAERNLQNASGTEQSSGLLAREAESLRYQVKRFVVKEEDER